MKRLLLIAGFALVLSVPGVAPAATLFTVPVIYVSPQTLNFGKVADKAIATNTFLVENAGSGVLIGAATVPAPFKIIEGGKYKLRENEMQIVTVIYTPTGAKTDTQTVKFTGGGGAKALVTGKSLNPGTKQSKRP